MTIFIQPIAYLQSQMFVHRQPPNMTKRSIPIKSVFDFAEC